MKKRGTHIIHYFSRGPRQPVKRPADVAARDRLVTQFPNGRKQRDSHRITTAPQQPHAQRDFHHSQFRPGAQPDAGFNHFPIHV